jgi:hypothetical protein
VVCGLWFVVCGLWVVVCGLWVVVCGLWFVVCGLSVVVCGLWFVVCGLWFVGCWLLVEICGLRSGNVIGLGSGCGFGGGWLVDFLRVKVGRFGWLVDLLTGLSHFIQIVTLQSAVFPTCLNPNLYDCHSATLSHCPGTQHSLVPEKVPMFGSGARLERLSCPTVLSSK